MTSLDESTDYHRWAEKEFAREYPDAVRAPPGSPYDFALTPMQIEVKGIAADTREGFQIRRGRVFIQMDSHRAFGEMPHPYYFIAIDGFKRHIVLTWGEMDRLIRSYKTFSRNSYPKGVECVKVGLRRMLEDGQRKSMEGAEH